jgi:uncharacterized protein
VTETAPRAPVTVRYFKHPRTPHWRHPTIRLGEDVHGVWLGVPAGTRVQRGDEPPIELAHDWVQLVPRDRWWVAIFNGPDHRIPIYVDITTVPHWVGPDLVEMVDLDLDVVRRQDGTVYVDDEDEFEEHRISLGYDARTVDTARGTAARLVLAVEAEQPPFDGTAATWLTELEKA